MVEAPGANQMSHYALVRGLAHGTARIDRWQAETIDKSYFKRHFYSVKAPGLAFAVTPTYKALDVTGLTGVARRAASRVASENQASAAIGPAAQVRKARGVVWALGLVGAVLPGFLLLLLLRSAADRIEPGVGIAVALLMGLGTLLLPFSAMLFAHVLSALLGFSAFLLLARGRTRPPTTAELAGAGALAGLAVVTEYPLVVANAMNTVEAAPRASAAVGTRRIIGASARPRNGSIGISRRGPGVSPAKGA